MEESLERRKAKRAGHRGVVTRYLQETRSLLDKETIDDKTRRRLGVLRGLLQHIKTRVNLTINYILPQNTQSKYTGPMKKHVYKCILLSLPLVQRGILNLFGRNYNQQTFRFLLILKLRLMASINTLFFCYKPIQVATSAIKISIH